MAIMTEVAELMNKSDSTMMKWAEKVMYASESLTNEEKDISSVVDAWAKKIASTGADPEHNLAQFIQKTIEPEVYDIPDELLSAMFDRGSVGEFDDYQIVEDSKNTLKSYEAAHGGTVDKSYVDLKVYSPTWKNRQIDTQLTFTDLRRKGYAAIARATTMAKETLQNDMVSDVFSFIDTNITGADQVIAITGGVGDLTLAAMDELSLYVLDNATDGDAPFTFSLSKYAQKISRMDGFVQYQSEGFKDRFNKYGLVDFYGGMKIGAISGAKKTSNGSLLVPDKRIFGVAGKIGRLDTRGELHVFQDNDYTNDRVNIYIKDYQYGYVITRPEKVAKITFTA